MKVISLSFTTLVLFAAPAISMAADKIIHLPFAQVVAEAQKAGRLDPNIKFYLAGNAPDGTVTVVNDNATTNRKTNAFGKKDQTTCDWVLQSALIALQDDAKAAGANAVVDIVSNYNDVVYSDPGNYECHVGFLMSGVQLKAKLAKVQ
ncbi:excinuclease [Dyella amyloliquefaciens]|uniref:excinuclease n=1 Tax=Dyella amyloliquefaciens TaxID=1770545 RepID=UPI00102EB2B7|nr:excinuclease [Dyella amyloliquefaciens]